VTGRIVASLLTDRDVDDASQVEPLLDQIAEPVEIFLGDGGYDRTGVYTTLDEHYPDAVIVVPPRADAVLSATADTPSATATSRQSPAKGGWPGSATAAITKEPASRASSRAGSRSSGTGCAATATKPGPPRLLSPPRSSTECSTARTPSASPDQQRGMGPPLPLPPLCNTLLYDDEGAIGARVQVCVPDLLVGEASATTLALVVHELATNSIKYGSLSKESGTVAVSCTAQDSEVVIVWTDTNGTEH
jgi:hypothetical protein